MKSMQGFDIRTLHWDTEYFGVKSGRIDIYKELSEEEKNLIKEEVKKYKFMTVSNANGCYKNNRFISEIGGYLVDVNIQLSKEFILKDTNGYLNSIKINNKYSYKEEIIDIAENTFEKSRFLNDQNISVEKAKGIYSNWVRNSFGKNGKYFVTKSECDKIIGFIIFSKNSDNSIVLELVGIDKNKKGIGIGKELMAEVDKYCIENNIKSSCVGTQIENINAINFYNRCGYKIRNITYIYHIWNR